MPCSWRLLFFGEGGSEAIRALLRWNRGAV